MKVIEVNVNICDLDIPPVQLEVCPEALEVTAMLLLEATTKSFEDIMSILDTFTKHGQYKTVGVYDKNDRYAIELLYKEVDDTTNVFIQ